ncbi:MAG: helix-turn-helix domain-containing protein [Proteobacteria bacterium]|nr:helix-turn-helix domain-containing protein [Pseudomonadota bacterium]
MQTAPHEPAFAPFIEACRAHGIAKTTAYELLSDGLLETFRIGRRRYVRLESLRALPDRLAAEAKAEADAKVSP